MIRAKHANPDPFLSRRRAGTATWRAFLLMAAWLPGAFFISGCTGVEEKTPKEETAMNEALYNCRVETDRESGRSVIVLSRGGESPLEARVAPQSGANLFSLKYRGVELLRAPQESLDEVTGYRFGTPVLYPAPNRVAGGKFSFEGRTFDWGVNDKDRFLHALVHSVPWEHEMPQAGESGARVVTYLEFKPGSALYEKFGFDHRLQLTFRLDREGLGLEYEVQNRDTRTLPFGFAIHPYFLFLEPRQQAYLSVPAGWHMEAVDLMPTGSLESLDGSPYDLRAIIQLAEYSLDEVYYGMIPEKPAVIEYRESGIRVVLAASAEFTHMVVYTQPENPFFCVENQTCSTD
ncbi:MAG: aldose 1-epimerase, partial [Gemmatimonadota bacterium]|nr:aldose 1-epimerase [Gemmatimonadota bacterium]